MRSSPQRLAWTVLIASFLVCCAISIGVPTAAWSFVNTATVTPLMTVRLQAGRTFAFCPPAREADARVVGQEGRALEEGCTVIVDDDTQSQSLLTIAPAERTGDIIASVQLYSGARLVIEQARIPRFSDLTPAPAVFVLHLEAGRIQVQHRHPPNRRVRMVVKTDLASTTLDSGVYSFETSTDETAIVVREGAAWVVSLAEDKTIVLRSDQRTAVTRNDGLQGILPPARNLVINGQFKDPLEADWQIVTDVSPRNGVPGTVSIIIGTDGNTSLLLDRSGIGLGWGRTGVWQQIEKSVSGRRSLQVRIEFAILYQELPVCGGYGSECPLLLKIIYTDKSGAEREWTQGFYADGIPSDSLPDEIITAPLPRNKHVAKRLGQRELFESEDLLTTLPDVQRIRSIWVYAEGHGVRTQVYSLQLLLTD